MAASSNASPSCGGTSHMLPAERARCSFDVAKLSKILGADTRAEAIRNARKLFDAHPGFQKPKDFAYMSYKEAYESTLEDATEAVKLTRDNPDFMSAHMSGKISMSDIFNTNGIGIHFYMFMTFLRANANADQKKAWLDLALEGKYFGCYAQTELGHGSNLRGLETLATFDKETDEFVIHSPTLTSLKWWPTGMYASTHAVVFANLVLDEKPCGVQGFFMQLRDERGYLMPGVEVGEMGPKVAPTKANIGYARFTHVRIPRFNMFSKHFKVTREGEFIAPPPKVGKMMSISMMEVRVFIVAGSANTLAMAATIATRYSCVRQQGFKNTTIADGKVSGENTILDYRMQQYRVFSALSLAYMLRWTGNFMFYHLGRVHKAINGGDLSAADELPELHATLSGLKAWATIISHEHMEDLRKACGGQGFMRSSALPDIVTSFMDPATVEGEQVIMSLQCARFLIKSVREVRAKKIPKGSVVYLQQPALSVIPFQEWGLATPSDFVALFEDRARRHAFELERRFAVEESHGKTFDQATNACAIQGYKAAASHSSFTVVARNLEALETFVGRAKEPAIYNALLRLFELQALVQIRRDAGDWLGLLTQPLYDSLLDRIHVLLDAVRPDAVGLVDAFAFEDSVLASTLGRFDGNVYEAIYEQAKTSPLNASPKMVGWDKLSEVLDLDFLKKGIGQRVSRL